jgi:hypothetical protein
MTDLKVIKGAKGQLTNLDPAYRALEPDILGLLRSAQIVELAEEHNDELVVFAIEQNLKLVEEFRRKYYEAYKG